MRLDSTVRLLVVTALVLALSGCAAADPPDDDSPSAGASSSGSAPDSRLCLEAGEAGEDETSLHLLAPEGWETGDTVVPQDAVAFGEAAAGWLPSVALDAFDEERFEDESDQALLTQAMLWASEGIGGGNAELKAARQRVLAEGLTEITFTTSDLGDDETYTVHAELVTVGSSRFAVSLFVPETDYATVADAVLPTVEPGPCT